MKPQPTRVFDLGGSGLKTAVINWDDQKEKFQVSDLIHLGKCPNNTPFKGGVVKWLEKKAKEKERFRSWPEEREGLGPIAFSLGGVGKMWEGFQWKKWEELGRGIKDYDSSYSKENISRLFGIETPSRCYVVADGIGHLLGSLHTNKEDLKHPVVNFCVGTSVGYCATNSKGEIRTDLDRSLGKHPFMMNCPAIGNDGILGMVSRPAKVASCLGATYRGLQFLQERCKGLSCSEEVATYFFHARWHAFLTDRLFVEYQKAGLTRPKTIIFTGGVAESGIFKNFSIENPKTDILSSVDLKNTENAGLIGAFCSCYRKFFKWDVADEKTILC